MPKPGVLFGGPSPEHDVSVLLGLPAARALGDASAIYWSKAGDFFAVDPRLEAVDFADGVPRAAEPLRLVATAGAGFVTRGGVLGREKSFEVGTVVNCCHGGPGEDGTLQAALDLAGIRYTGPTAAGAALGMDKFAFGAAAAAAGIPTLPREILTAAAEPDFSPPYIVKPRFGGSSIGIDLVQDGETARARLRANVHLRRGAVVEPYRDDLFDINVAVRTFPEVQLSAIERPRRKSEGSGILSYSDKYVRGEGMDSAPRELPAVIPDTVEKRIREIALAVVDIAQVRGVARIDFLGNGGHELYLNEINTIPGSLSRYLWIDPPLPFEQLLADLVAEAESRPTVHFETEGADGTVLRSAGSIAGKLG